MTADGASVTMHGMLPGSHEAPRGAECRCGAEWSRWEDRCAVQAAPSVRERVVSGPSPVEVLREAASRMRATAEAELVLRDGDPYYKTTLLVDGTPCTEQSAFERRWRPEVALAVADWLDSEAVVLGERQPFVELVNATVTHASGVETALRFGRGEDGEPAMQFDTSPAALFEEPHPITSVDWRAPCSARCKPGHRRKGKDGYDFCPAVGMFRNERMVQAGADRCLAFIHRQSTGASGCADLAEAAGIATRRYRWPMEVCERCTGPRQPTEECDTSRMCLACLWGPALPALQPAT